MAALAEVEDKIDSVEKEIKQKTRTKEKLEAGERQRGMCRQKIKVVLSRKKSLDAKSFDPHYC